MGIVFPEKHPGWTLQELVAPTLVEFFSKEGEQLGSKRSLEQHIHEVTRIPIKALRGNPLSEFSLLERMLWGEDGDTTCKEDKAYSLLGIFDVHMPLIYGEGESPGGDPQGLKGLVISPTFI